MSPPDARSPAAADDEQAQEFLRLLRDGDRAQKRAARVGLAEIFERRGLIDEAIELYEANVWDGVRDPDLYTHLAYLYRRQGLDDIADEALQEAERLRQTRRRFEAQSQPRFVEPPLAGTEPPEPLVATAEPAEVRPAPARPPRRRRGSPRQDWLWLGLGLTLILLLGQVLSWSPARLADGTEPGSAPPSTPTAAAPTPLVAVVVPAPHPPTPLPVPRPSPPSVADCTVAESPAACPSPVASPSPPESEPALAAPEPTLAPPASLAGSLLPSRRVVAYYGHPLSRDMGILGELPPDQMLERLLQRVESYAVADPSRPVIPALELVAVVAQEQPGPDGLYRARVTMEQIEEVADWARSVNGLLILDVQPGRASMVDEVMPLLPLLKRSYVHLALDPEFAMRPDQVPGQVIGSLDADAINQVSQMLAELVTAEQIPPKLLIVHRFTENMVTNADQIQRDPRVQVVVDMDGFGAPSIKVAHYQQFIRDEKAEFGAIKLFHQHDQPVMTPEDVLRLEPAPDVVIYQ